MTLSPIQPLLQLVSPQATLVSELSDVEWEMLANLAELHSLGSLVHSRLEPIMDALPPHVQETLHRSRIERSAQTMLQEIELQRLVTCFREAGVPLLPFKGIPLARQLYGDPSVRPTCDIDVMVREAALPAASRLIASMGWTPGHHWEIHNDFVKEVAGHRLLLELHWSSQRRGEYHINEDRYWQEASERADGWSFSPELTLLVLVLHAARHVFLPYRQLVDVAHAVACWNDTLDWEQVVQIAREAQAIPVLATVLAMVHRDLGAPLPRHPQLVSEMTRGRVRAASNYFSARRLLSRRRFPGADRYLLPLASGAWHPVRNVLGDIIRTPEQIAYIYKLPNGSRLIPLYHLLRPFLLTRKYLKNLLAR
jgi:hypothetical protein